MKKEEKLIVSAYTGFLMCDWDDLHKFIEDTLGRPVWAHELADDKVTEDVRLRLKPRFLAICAAQEESSQPNWIPVAEKLPEEYVDVLCYYEYFRYGEYNCMFRTVDRGYYGHGRWGGEAGAGHKNKVLYWMPLPKPPKEVQA